MRQFLVICGTLWFLISFWRELILLGAVVTGINWISRRINDVVSPVTGEIVVAPQMTIDTYAQNVDLTLTNKFEHEVYANVAVCAFHGPVYYDASEQFWYGSDNHNQSADEYVGDDRLS